MLFQAIIGAGAGLETLEDFCIASFNLTIALWVSNRRIANLNAKVFVVPVEGTTSKLGPIVSYDPVRDPEPTNDRLDELDC
jgi:IMP cyclohydrolase